VRQWPLAVLLLAVVTALHFGCTAPSAAGDPGGSEITNGKVLAMSGGPAAGITVTGYPVDYLKGSHRTVRIVSAVTDEQGMFELPIDSGKYNLFIIDSLDGSGCCVRDIGPREDVGTVPDENPLVREELIYRLNEASGSFGLSLAVKTSYFEDGSEETEEFTSTALTAETGNARSSQRLDAGASLKRGRLVMSPSFSGEVSGALIDCKGRTVQRFSRDFRRGATYFVPCGRVSAGMYWLRLSTAEATRNIQLSTFE
jgi:hypothetical protein